MARIVPATEVGLPEGAGRVRVSSSRARKGKILAVEHPIFGWISYKQWAIWRMVPEDRIVPAIIGGVGTFFVLKVSMDALGKVQELLFSPDPTVLDIILPGGAIMAFLKVMLKPLIQGNVQDLGPKLSDVWTKSPIPFFGAVVVAAMIMAGVDPGNVIVAITNLIPGL